MPTAGATARLAVAAITNFEKRTEDGLSDPFAEVKWWREKGLFVTKSHGSSIRWQAVTARQSTTGFNRETRTDFVPTNRLITASLPNSGYSAAGQIHQTDLWEAMGDQQIIDLLKHEMEWTPEAMWRALTQDWYLAGTTYTRSSNPITGIQGAIVSSGTYAGVSYTNESTWFGGGSNVISGGVHDSFSVDPIPSLTASVLQAEQGTDAGQATTYPDGIFMTYTNWATLHNALQAQGRGDVTASKYQTGATDLTFMGIPVHRTRFQTASQYYVLNSKFMDFRTPAPKMLNTFKREEPSPWSVIMLMVFYGLFRVTLPRANVRVSVT